MAFFHEALRRLRTNLDERCPMECGNEVSARGQYGKVLVRTDGRYLSENPDYSQENYHRRRHQRTRGFLAPDYLPYKGVGVLHLDPLDLVEDVFACDLRPQLTTAKEHKTRNVPSAVGGEDTVQLLANRCLAMKAQSVDNKEQSGLYDDTDEEDEEPGMSLHSGLSTMRLMLGANDRRIYAQQFGQAHYDVALQREKQRMEYLKKMWAHSPQEEGHHPSKYLSPMVHTSSSKGCLVSSPPSSKARASSLHDSETGTDEDSHESLTGPHSAPDQFALFQHMLGKGSSKGEPSVQRGKRTRNNSFYVAMAASTFKKRPDRHRAKIKALVEEQLKLDVLLAKVSSVYRVFCALINIRNKDLRSNQPISPKTLKQMMCKPNESFLRGDYNYHHPHHQQQSQTPHVHLPPHRTNSNLSKVGSQEQTAQTSNSLQSPHSRAVSPGGSKVGGQSVKPPLLLPIGTSSPPNNPRVVNFDSHPTWEDLQHAQYADIACTMAPAEGKATRSRIHSSLMHSKMNNPPPHHAEPMSVGTRAAKEIPIWQKPIVSPDGALTQAKRTPKPEERVARAKQAFQDAKNKHAQKLQERMREMEEDGSEYFVQTLKELHLGPLVQVNLEQMRTRAHSSIRKMKVKEDNKPMWYLKLEKEGQSLITLRKNERLLHLMKKLQQFEELNVATVSHLKEKLCLFVMSLPVYLLAEEHMIAAILFVLKEVLAVSPNLLQLWANARRLPLLTRQQEGNV